MKKLITWMGLALISACVTPIFAQTPPAQGAPKKGTANTGGGTGKGEQEHKGGAGNKTGAGLNKVRTPTPLGGLGEKPSLGNFVGEKPGAGKKTGADKN